MDSRRALLLAARACFLERGFAATSVDEIRRRANVSNGSLFHHFPSKSHLARALYLESLESFQEAISRALRDSESASDAIARMIGAHLDWITHEREAARVLVELRDATIIDGTPVDWAEVNARAFDELRELIARSVAAGETIDIPFGVWMALVFAPVLELTRRWVSKPKITIAPAVRDALIRAAQRAIEPPNAKSKKSHPKGKETRHDR